MASSDWPGPKDIDGEPVRLTLEQWEELPRDNGQTYRTCRCLRAGRYHTVWRQFSFGQRLTFYHPVILTTVSQSEAIC